MSKFSLPGCRGLQRIGVQLGGGGWTEFSLNSRKNAAKSKGKPKEKEAGSTEKVNDLKVTGKMEANISIKLICIDRKLAKLLR